MLTRTTTRRSAVVLMVTLVAMLLVATGGTARAVQARVSAGTGQASAAPHPGRHIAAAPAALQDQSPWHLDLASTPPDTDAAPATVVADRVSGVIAPDVAADPITAIGRAPPAL